MEKPMDIPIIGELPAPEKEEIDVEKLFDTFMSAAKQEKIHGFFALAIIGDRQIPIYDAICGSEIKSVSLLGAVEVAKWKVLKNLTR